ncbi:hypothetical protein BDZ97DRAFT_1927624 [Flammula alnicola]|nr:hypothetical protein BDZ97DRAFT_1927624 [Flammula alnicola]
MSDVFEVLCELDSKNIIHGAITGTPDNLLFITYQQSDPIKDVLSASPGLKHVTCNR